MQAGAGAAGGGARPLESLGPRGRAGAEAAARAHLAHVEVQRGPLAAQRAVLDVAGGGQRQEAEQAAGEAGAGHGAGALGRGRRLRRRLGLRAFYGRGRAGGALSKPAAA